MALKLPGFLSPFLLTLVYILSCQQLYAGHGVASAEISYKQLATLKFEVTLKLYRNCQGLSTSNPSDFTHLKCISENVKDSLSLTLISIEEITPINDYMTGGCTPPNTSSSGQGIEMHIYKDTVDLNDTSYLSYQSGCDLILEFENCCRSNSGASNNETLYIYTEMDLCNLTYNSSPEFTSRNLFYLCCNQAVYINPGAIDTVDYDSLSFHLTPALKSYGVPITYSSTNSYQKPLSVYYPGTSSFPACNPNANPPIGICLDPSTGNLVFTPTQCSEIANVCIEVTEWRKDSTGTYQKIGSNRRDMLFTINTCSSNNPPEISMSDQTVCAGSELCFNVYSSDDVFVPPPPANTPSPDTVRLQWNEAIPGATFEILNDSDRLQTGYFCWTPTDEQVKNSPYLFYLEARDNNTNLNAVTQKSIQIHVRPNAKSKRTISPLGCEFYKIESLIDSIVFPVTATYSWVVKDSNDHVVSQDSVYFTSTTRNSSTLSIDTLKFKQAGYYILEHRINNPPNNCPVIYRDTLEVNNTFHILLNHKDISFCTGTEQQLLVSSYNDQVTAYRWYLNDSLLSETDSVLHVDHNSIGEKRKYRVEADALSGCSDADLLEIETIGVPVILLDDTNTACGLALNLDAGTHFSSINWNTGDKLAQITVQNSGKVKYLADDSLGCLYSDSTEVIIYTLDSIMISDHSVCEDSIVLDAGFFEEYLWSTGSEMQKITLNQSDTYSVQVKDINGCIQHKTVSIELFGYPTLHLGADTSFCCEDQLYELKNHLGNTDPDGGAWFLPSYPNALQSNGFHPSAMCDTVPLTAYAFYRFTDPHTACVFEDSVEITVNPSPLYNLKDKSFCLSDSIIDLESELLDIHSAVASGRKWNCIECNENDADSFIINQGDTEIPDYRLYTDPLYYQMLHDEQDTIILELLLSNSHSCLKRDTVKIYLASNPAKPILSKQGNMIEVTNASATVQWFRNDSLLSGNTTDLLYAPIPGIYTAYNINSYGCYSPLSNPLIQTAGIETLIADHIRIIPNPGNGEVRVELADELRQGTYSITITDQRGKTIDFSQGSTDKGFTLSIHATSGIYTLELRSGERLFRKQIVIVQ